MKKVLVQRYDNELDILAIERNEHSDVYRRSTRDDFEIVAVVPTAGARSQIAVVADARSRQYTPTTETRWPGRDDRYPVRVDVENVRYTTSARVRYAVEQAGYTWAAAWTVLFVELDERLLDFDEDAAELAADEEMSAVEGELRERLVKHRRREARLRAYKIKSFKDEHEGRLFCEVPRCGFDFERVYGPTGKDYAQVHHRTPLAELDQPRPTTLRDLAVVCANCHAMVHRGGQCRDLDQLIPGP
jgi:hypothetical protein